jgi:hypothetical protein
MNIIEEKYDCYICIGINHEFSKKFASRHSMDETECFVVDPSLEKIEETYGCFIKKKVSTVSNETSTNLFSIISRNQDIFLRIETFDDSCKDWFEKLSTQQLQRFKRININTTNVEGVFFDYSVSEGVSSEKFKKIFTSAKGYNTLSLIRKNGKNKVSFVDEMNSEKEKIINFGTNTNYVKMVSIDDEDDYEGEYTFELAKTPYEDAFDFKVVNGLLVITRTDKKEGWGYSHSVKIKRCS